MPHRAVGPRVPGTGNWAAIIVSIIKNKEKFPLGIYLPKSLIFRRSSYWDSLGFVSLSVSNVARNIINCCASFSSLKKVNKSQGIMIP